MDGAETFADGCYTFKEEIFIPPVTALKVIESYFFWN